MKMMILNLMNNSFRRKSDATLNLFRYTAMVAVLLMLGVGNAWAGGNSKTYHSTMNVAVASGQSGYGTVYVTSSGKTSDTKSSESSSSSVSHSYNIYATANTGYKFTSWSGSGITFGSTTTANTTGSISTSSTSSPGTSKTATASFEVIKVTAAPADVTINATDPSATYPDAAGVVVGFTTSSSNANSDFTTGGSGDSRWTISAWPTHASATSTTFNYKFVGNGSYGTNNRTLTKTVTLKGLNDGTTKTCTLTAKYPNPKVVECNEGSTDLTIYPTFKSTDETQEAVEKTAVFDVVYADNANNFSAAFSGATGGGTWIVTGISVDQANQKATVTYTFNGNKAVGTHTAVLTLTANDCKGWDDTSAAGGASATVTLTAENMQEATDDAKVIAANGTTLIYQGDWITALSRANTAANAGCTLQLLRNVHLNDLGQTATQAITNTFTLDLNGKTLSGSINGSVLNPKTAGKTLTIKDSKTGGKIQNITPNYNGVTYGVNISAGSVVLESGTIHAENNAVFNHSTLTGLGTRAVKLAANSTFEMKGGMLEAVGGREVYGIYQESSSANNTADKSVVTIKGGTIKAEAPAYVYGIRSYGKVNMSDGTIDVIVNTGTVNSNESYVAANFNDNTLHRYGYGIRMYGSASATTSSNYSGTLTITGGTINVTNQNKTMNGTTMYNEHIYGINMDVSVTGAGAGKTAPDGTKVQKACAVGSIENATINLNHAGVLGYGVLATGCYNSYNNTYTPLQIKNSTINVTTFQTAYGVYANAYINWNSTLTKLTGNGGCTYGDVELTNVTINATTTGGTGAYCAWASCTSGTVANAKATTGSTSEGNATYYGEYAVAGKITVNSGTFTADAKTSSAYGIGSSDRAKCVRNVNGVFSGRDAADNPQGSLSDYALTSDADAYPELYIHGGNFSATTGTTTAIAVKSGGNTLIDGGTFNAFAGTTTAYGLYVTAGKTTANGVTFPASATTVAYGVYVNAAISDWSLFPYAGEVELNNCNATATARTTTDARGVYVNGTTKVYTQASFDAMKSANNSNYKNYGDYAQVGERSIVGKATINGGTYSATAETTTAYGIYVMSTRVSTNKEAIAYNPLVVKNATIAAKTNTGTTAYGIQHGGGALIEGCTISATAGTTTASGVRAIDKTTVIKNSTITAKGTDVVYGLEGYVDASTAHGYCWHGDFDLSEAGTTKVTAESTGATKAWAIYLNAKAVNVASGTFAGDYATAANATINGGTYIAKTNGGTNGYAISLTGTQTKGTASAQPEVLVTDGKFNGSTAEVGTAGVVGHLQLKGGYYVHNTNLSKYIPEGYEEFPLPNDRPEYTEGYRYAIEPVGNHGNYVCQIGSTKYKTLEEALQAANSGNTILMIANYTLSAGDWILKSGVKLLVPYSGQTSTKETNLEVVEGTATPSQNLKLSFAEGAHLVCNGVIEAGAKQTGQGSSELTGQVYGSYGHIYMAEGSSITIESGATLYAWGYVTGKGEITIKNGGKSYEMFQFGWYKGGNTTSSIYSNRNSYKIFPMTDYSYQNIECPIMYYPGASAYGRSAVKPSSYSSMEKPLAMLVGTADNCMFRMTTTEASANTWVKKVYDPETDITNWIMNSGAAISGISMSVGVSVNSADFYLPITSNFRITLNYGDMNINNDVIFLPGSQLIINKEATGILKSGKLLFFYDAEDWFTGLGHVSVTASGWSKAKTSGYYYYPATYSPTWNTANPRKNVYARDKASIDKGVTPLPDAELFVHGKMIVNGSLYTSGDGNASSIGRNANIHSTNEDAGKIQFNTKVTGSKALYKVCFAVGTTEANNSWSDMIYGGQTTAYPAHLANGDGTYVQSSGTEAGKQYVYVDNQWQCWEENGCYTYDAQNNPYAKPAAYVQLTSDQPDDDPHHLLHDAETGNRNFVWDQNCYWWEVVTTPTAEGYYQSINPDYNGKYNYYYYDGSANCWKIKKITVTWNIEGSTTNYSVGYGTKPEWYGGTPSKTSSSSNYYYIWDGWIVPGSETLLANSELPEVTDDITFTAHFYEKYYEYNITFKNDDGTVLDSRNWNKGTTPSYEGTPTKNATVDYTYEFNGTWNPDIKAVDGSATYVAQYDASPRAYTITFLNYDMSVLGTAEVVYNGTPTNATYLAAVAPLTEDPYKPDNSAFSFEFAGWRLQGASSNGFAQVKGDQSYIAQFNQTTKKYKISFVDDDGETVLHYLQLEYGQTPSYTWANPSKQDAEWTYSFTGWTPATFSEVQGPQTYVANYNKTKRKYDITWVDGNGATLKTEQVAYGTTPAYTGETPTKTATAQYTYTFNNTWSPALASVTGDATYTAQFNSTVNKYDITWVDGNGATLKTEQVEYGQTPAYTGATPTKTATVQYTYTFNNTWSPAIVAVTGAATYTAQFGSTVNKYTITWVDGNGATLKTEQVAYGQTPAYIGETPTKTATAQYTYTFNNTWSPAITSVTGDATYTAQFGSTVNEYTITWVDGNGETLLSEQLTYGETPNYTGETPGKKMTTGVVYTFKGWTPEPTTVTGNATYTATFLEAPRPYPVLWVDWNGHTLASTQRSYGDPAPPASQNTSIPTRASENGKVYTFSGWSDPVSVVEGGDVTYTALYRVDLLANEPSLPVEINEDTEVVTTTVRVSGALHIANNAKLTTTDLILEAGESQSGEITGNVVANNVYFDLAIEADKRHWNVFGVPFKIGDLDNTKLQYKNSGETTWHNMILGTHYDITYHDEATRASRGPVYDCWKYIEDLPAGNRTLQPGVAYSISLLFHVDTLRFTKASNSPIHYSENVDLVNTNTGDATNGGWNGIANPATYHTLLATGVDMIQIHDGGEIGHDSYDAYRIEDYKFVVGKAGYVQVTAAHSILDVDEAGGQAPIPSVHAAPRRSNGITASELYTVELSAENMRTDRVYVKADEDKADEYTIGSDVMKLSTSQARPQIWVEQYNVKLCKSTMAPVNGQTVYPLGLYAPVAGEYTITNNQSAEVEEENTLYLTYDGLPIWNLTDAPYSIQLEKGTNMHYGLLLVRNYAPSVTTGTEEIQTGLQAAQKVLWNNQVYILRGGEVYTVTGKKVQ